MRPDRIDLPRREARIDHHRPSAGLGYGEEERDGGTAVLGNDDNPVPLPDIQPDKPRHSRMDGGGKRAERPCTSAVDEGRPVGEDHCSLVDDIADLDRQNGRLIGQILVERHLLAATGNSR